MKLLAGATFLTLTLSVHAEESAEPVPGGAKHMSGMSVLGNSEAPKSLVIVPWKSSEIGDGVGVANMLDGRAVPVDRDVFARELKYYELRTGDTSSTEMRSGLQLADTALSRGED